jgi:hypothetical protein
MAFRPGVKQGPMHRALAKTCFVMGYIKSWDQPVGIIINRELLLMPPLFRAKARELFGCLNPRTEVRGNSNIVLFGWLNPRQEVRNNLNLGFLITLLPCHSVTLNPLLIN